MAFNGNHDANSANLERDFGAAADAALCAHTAPLFCRSAARQPGILGRDGAGRGGVDPLLCWGMFAAEAQRVIDNT